MTSLENILKMKMSYPGIEIKAELTVLGEYLSQMDSGIKLICDNYIENELKKYEGCEYYEYQHVYMIAEDQMPKIIKMPFIVTIYTFFENSVSLLLSYARKEENKDLSLKDIKGRTLISTFNKYLKYVLGYEYQFDSKFSETFSNINKVRNCIAHTNGNLSSLSDQKIEELREVSLKMKGLKVRGKELEVTTIFMEEAMSFVDYNLRQLMEYIEVKFGWR
jgi:hypothetical protein